ncbi:response regulator [Streptomyces canus]|uniref:response regulator n=1 Tax=Streptomyces canus TaxID=58343 RepID=UPI003CF59D82
MVVDDQAVVRAGFAAIVDAEPDLTVVGEAGGDGASAVSLAAAEGPDLVLMDIPVPGMDGLTATRLVTALESRPRVLVLTTFDLDASGRAARPARGAGGGVGRHRWLGAEDRGRDAAVVGLTPLLYGRRLPSLRVGAEGGPLREALQRFGVRVHLDGRQPGGRRGRLVAVGGAGPASGPPPAGRRPPPAGCG